MRIAIDISQVAYQGTGVANYTKKLVENLLKIDQENEYLLIGFSLRNLSALNDYFTEIKFLHPKVSKKFFFIPQTIGNFIWNRLHKINLETLIGKVDIFHSSDWLQPPAFAKKVTTVHDLVIYRYPETSHPYIVETQKRRLFWVRKEVEVILADSYSTKNDLQEIFSFPPSRIKVVYPGVDKRFKPVTQEEKDKIRKKYSLPADYVLTVGTREPRKNLQRLIRAFKYFLRHPLVLAKERPIELVVVGKKGWEEEISREKFLHLLGYVEEEDMPALYSSALLFVYPSLYEGFGLPVLEAAACGTVVVTSNRGSLKEIAGNSALLVDPELEDDIAIKMVRGFADKGIREELKRKGKENAARFSWEKTAKNVLEVYQNLFNA